MIFNTITNQLFTDEMLFIKKLECPFKIKWEELEITTKEGVRNCNQCVHEIVDTRFLSDEKILSIIMQNPKACFKINLRQRNLRVVKNEKGSRNSTRRCASH